jgi:predicted component of type VI protein secretion system
METVKTNLHVKKLFKEVTDLAPDLAYETLEDFVDEAIRQQYTRVLEYVVARNQVMGSRK